MVVMRQLTESRDEYGSADGSSLGGNARLSIPAQECDATVGFHIGSAHLLTGYALFPSSVGEL